MSQNSDALIDSASEKMNPTPALAAIVGAEPLARCCALRRALDKAASCQPATHSDSTTQIDLNDPHMRFECDAQLLALTGKKYVSLFELCSSVIHHLR